MRINTNYEVISNQLEGWEHYAEYMFLHYWLDGHTPVVQYEVRNQFVLDDLTAVASQKYDNKLSDSSQGRHSSQLDFNCLAL